jgi:pyruvate kinase
LECGVDVVAISFVRTVDDVVRVQRKMAACGREVPIIAKLEKPQAIQNLDAILETASGVMVARGDLGVEMAPEKVPVIQKQVIRRAFDFRRPVITATQMLESMIENPRPTRAEANDVANAILDGTDAVMLSGETAAGKYPREAVEMMSRIVVEAEEFGMREPRPERHPTEKLSLGETVCEAMAHAVRDLDIRAIAVYTETATSARMLSKYRPNAQIYAFSTSEAVCNRVNLLWGVTPMRCPNDLSVEQMANFAEQELTRRNALAAGEVFGLIAGTTNVAGGTNFLRLIRSGGPR